MALKDNEVWKAVKPFMNGGLSGMGATCVIQPLDIVKVRLRSIERASDRSIDRRTRGRSIARARWISSSTFGPPREGGKDARRDASDRRRRDRGDAMRSAGAHPSSPP
jgi:hypothetical protein